MARLHCSQMVTDRFSKLFGCMKPSILTPSYQFWGKDGVIPINKTDYTFICLCENELLSNRWYDLRDKHPHFSGSPKVPTFFWEWKPLRLGSVCCFPPRRKLFWIRQDHSPLYSGDYVCVSIVIEIDKILRWLTILTPFIITGLGW